MNDNDDPTTTGTSHEGNRTELQGDEEGRRVNRREFLRTTTAASVVGASGLGLASGSAGAKSGCWSPGSPPLETQWFSDVSPSNAWPEYPRPQMQRSRWQSLNGEWGWEVKGRNDSVPTGQTLNDCILVPYPTESALSGIQSHEESMWYRETFSVPDTWDIGSSEQLILHFEAVDYDATVYVNGTEVGSHVGGFDHFAFDITSYLESDPQELILAVDDPTDDSQALGKQRDVNGCIWYTAASGIWQSVWIEPVPTSHIDSLDMEPDIANEQLLLTTNASNASGLTVEAKAFDGSTEVGSVTGDPNTQLQLPVPSPKLWSPENPFLYDLDVNLLDSNGNVVDSVDSYFGMREVGIQTINGKERITLNGDFLFQVATLDQGYWPDGIYTPPTDTAMQFDLQKHVDMNYNTVRKHVKVENRRFYYHCDTMGLLVEQDMPSMFDSTLTEDRNQFEKELSEMIDQLYNHPSIIMWVPFNEGWGYYDGSRITNDVKNQDPTRIVNTNSGSDVGGGVPDNSDVLDHHNYVGPDPEAPSVGRPSMLGEHGGIGLEISGHQWSANSCAHGWADSQTDLTNKLVDDMERIRQLMESKTVASVWTQITDVEDEINGLLTYDRDVVKVDEARVGSVIGQILDQARNRMPVSMTDPGDGSNYWKMNDGSGDTATDSVGSADATLVGDPQWVSGFNSGGIDLDGTDDYLDTGTTLVDTTADYSVSAWVNFDALDVHQTVASQDGSTVSGFFLQYDWGNDRLGFNLPHSDSSSPTFTRLLANTAPETNTWYHVVGVHDSANDRAKLYVNGQLVDGQHYSNAISTSGAFVMGRALFDGSQVDFVNGTIDDAHVYNTALTDEEVRSLYNSESNGKLASYPFEEGSGSTTTDTVRNDSAALVNGPSWVSGHNGTALDFDGTDDYVDTGIDLINANEDYSVAAWVNFDDLSNWRTAVSQDGVNVSPFFLQYSQADDRLAFSVTEYDSGNTDSVRALSGSSPSTNTWYHLVGVRDSINDVVKLYVDGTLADTTDFNAGFYAQGPTVVGRALWDGNQVDFFDGTIDQVHLYSKALSGTEVSDLYNAEK